MDPSRNTGGQSKSYYKIFIIIGVILALVPLILLARACVSSLRNRLAAPETTTTTTVSSGFPEMRNKPQPVNRPFKGCPPEGDGGDPALNRLKNRIDEGNYIPVQFDAVAKLPWPKEIERKHRDRWPASAADAIARYEGTPIAVEGYLAEAKEEGPESPNCHGADHEFRDFHVWLTKSADDDRSGSIVVEMTPPLRANHPNWRTDVLRRIARDKQQVRVSGWLMLDPEHPDQVGKTRGTIWEIHPVLKVEVNRGGMWTNLDNLR